VQCCYRNSSPSCAIEVSTRLKQHDRHYILATGNDAVARLQLLDRIFGPSTRELLKCLNIPAGAHVAEIGCGTGLTSLWIASELVPTCSVVAVDASPEQLRIAEAVAARQGISNVSFTCADAYNLSLAHTSFDLAYSRFLLCHLDSPATAFTQMKALLKPGGSLLCEDHDNGGIFTEPPTTTYRRLVEISDAMNRAHGLDSHIGLKLPSLFRASGFPRPQIRVNQLAFLRGEEKRFWRLTLREAAPKICAAGISTATELEAICDEMDKIAQDESILVMLARVTQVWARRE
jgi:SAM-dependent methyltransferase